MISIIICSVNKAFAHQISENIKETIGVDFEILCFDNTIEKLGINEVYNNLASTAKFDMLCFVHEDVTFSTQDWGHLLVSKFNSINNLGLIGLAGAKYKSSINSGWYTGIDEIDCCNIKHINAKGKVDVIYANPQKNDSPQEVVVIDGVFMCCKKNVWNEFRFNQQLLDGFHFYDLDFSLRISSKYKTIVVYDIYLNHFTEGGSFKEDWMRHSLKWHSDTIIAALLPLKTQDLALDLNFKTESAITKTWLKVLMKSEISFAYRLKWLKNIKLKYLLHNIAAVALFLFYNMLKGVIRFLKKGN